MGPWVRFQNILKHLTGSPLNALGTFGSGSWALRTQTGRTKAHFQKIQAKNYLQVLANLLGII
jgi:hypothetical protein